MNFPILETERLLLVEVKEEYVESFFEIMSNDEVTKYYGMDSLKTMNEAKNIIQSFKDTYASNRGIRWAMILKETDTFVGTLGLNNLNPRHKRAEVGYDLHPNYWNNGLTTEAVKEVLRYSFEELQLLRIGAVTYPKNEPSMNVLRKLGFQEEGNLRGYIYQNNQSNDVVSFSVLKNEWEGRRR